MKCKCLAIKRNLKNQFFLATLLVGLMSTITYIPSLSADSGKEFISATAEFQEVDSENVRVIFVEQDLSIVIPKSQFPPGSVARLSRDGSVTLYPKNGEPRLASGRAQAPKEASSVPQSVPDAPEGEAARASAVFDGAKAPDGAVVPSVVSGSDLVSNAFADAPAVEEPADKAPAPEVNSGGGQTKQKGKPFKALGKWAADNVRALVAGGVAGALVGGILAIATYGTALTLATALNPILIGAAVGAGLFFLITNITKFMS